MVLRGCRRTGFARLLWLIETAHQARLARGINHAALTGEQMPGQLDRHLFLRLPAFQAWLQRQSSGDLHYDEPSLDEVATRHYGDCAVTTARWKTRGTAQGTQSPKPPGSRWSRSNNAGAGTGGHPLQLHRPYPDRPGRRFQKHGDSVAVASHPGPWLGPKHRRPSTPSSRMGSTVAISTPSWPPTRTMQRSSCPATVTSPGAAKPSVPQPRRYLPSNRR